MLYSVEKNNIWAENIVQIVILYFQSGRGVRMFKYVSLEQISSYIERRIIWYYRSDRTKLVLMNYIFAVHLL